MAIKYSILGLLHYKDMHGYRIKEHIERNFGHMWSINYGQIYPNLKKLCDDGLIRMHEKTRNGDKGGPPRKLYSITEKGREEFVRWLHDSPERTMIMRDPFLMRFVFFGFGDRDKALELIDEQIREYELQLKRRGLNKTRWSELGDYVRMVADLGITFNEMYLDWLKRARDEIAQKPPSQRGNP
ncbi:MAG: PadR family transcriptional regulator [Thermodesulfobacteriota bacterium]